MKSVAFHTMKKRECTHINSFDLSVLGLETVKTECFIMDIAVEGVITMQKRNSFTFKNRFEKKDSISRTSLAMKVFQNFLKFMCPHLNEAFE